MGSLGRLAIGTYGPVVTVEVGVSQAYANNASRRGRPVPAPVIATFLVDTGASVTVVDPRLVTRLGLVPRASALATTVMAGSTIQASQYDVSITLSDIAAGSSADLVLGNLLVAEISLGTPHYDGLLGRPVLQHCQLLYDGPGGSLVLDW